MRKLKSNNKQSKKQTQKFVTTITEKNQYKLNFKKKKTNTLNHKQWLCCYNLLLITEEKVMKE